MSQNSSFHFPDIFKSSRSLPLFRNPGNINEIDDDDVHVNRQSYIVGIQSFTNPFVDLEAYWSCLRSNLSQLYLCVQILHSNEVIFENRSIPIYLSSHSRCSSTSIASRNAILIETSTGFAITYTTFLEVSDVHVGLPLSTSISLLQSNATKNNSCFRDSDDRFLFDILESSEFMQRERLIEFRLPTRLIHPLHVNTSWLNLPVYNPLDIDKHVSTSTRTISMDVSECILTVHITNLVLIY